MHLFSNTPPPKNGYVLLREYVSYLHTFTSSTGWKLPLHVMDKLQLLLLKFVCRWSWFADRIHIEEFSTYGLGYDQVYNYLRTHLFDIVLQRQTTVLPTLTQYHWRVFTKGLKNELEPFALGTDFDNHTAVSKALGEAIERYFTLLTKPHQIPTKRKDTYRAVSRGLTDVYFPPLYHSFTPAQLVATTSLHKDGNQSIEWVEGRQAKSKKTVLIPKQLISRQCQKLLVPQEGLFYQLTTNGSAGWFSEAGAKYRATFELIQRDAFLVSWLKKRKLLNIDISTINNPQVAHLLKHIQAARAEVSLLIPEAAANVPTVIVLTKDYGVSKERVYITAHSDTTVEKAILGALQETLVFFSEREQLSLPQDYVPFITKGIGRRERLGLYVGGQDTPSVTWLDSGNTVTLAEAQKYDFKAKTDELIWSELVERLGALGQDFLPISYTYRHKTLKKVGFHVVKCFVPALFPLYLTEHMATLKSKRLGTYDLASHEEVIAALNQDPHPFP